MFYKVGGLKPNAVPLPFQDPRDLSPDPQTDSQRIAKRNHIRKLVEATERISFRRAMESSESSDSDSSPTRSYVRKLKIRRLREEVKNLQRTKNTYQCRIKRQSKKISMMRELLSDLTKKNSLMLLNNEKN
uniref:Uncharacterized protein n=1 Tax=Lutzomyia longipalpis TaxID=7200 RepID=A0A1B0C9F3_LUTLO